MSEAKNRGTSDDQAFQPGTHVTIGSDALVEFRWRMGTVVETHMGEVRVVIEGHAPRWFLAKDVCALPDVRLTNSDQHGAPDGSHRVAVASGDERLVPASPVDPSGREALSSKGSGGGSTSAPSEEWSVAAWREDGCPCTRCNVSMAWEGDDPDDASEAICGGCKHTELQALRERVKGTSDAPPEKTWEQAVADGSVAKSLAEDGRIARFRQWAGETLKDWFDNAEARQIVAYVDASRPDYPIPDAFDAKCKTCGKPPGVHCRAHYVARIAELETALKRIAEGDAGDSQVFEWPKFYASIKNEAREALATQKRGDE